MAVGLMKLRNLLALNNIFIMSGLINFKRIFY